MAGLPMIETGYKPKFGLGALYQGFNAANADQSAQEELLKQFLANQREQSMQPLDINIRGMESDRATQARSPEMLQAYKDLYLAQRDQTKASGDKARELSVLDIATGRQDLQHKQAVNQLIAKLDALKAGGDSGQIGFPMQESPTQAQPTSGFNWKIPSEVQAARDQASLGIMQQEQQLYPTDKALQTDIRNRQQTLSQNSASPTQEINANNSPVVQQPPLRNGGITQGSPEYERVMQALVDQPELRAALIKGDQKLDSSEFLRMVAMQQAEKLAALRQQSASRGSENKDDAEKAYVRSLKQQYADGNITLEQLQGALVDVQNKKFAKPEQQGIKPIIAPDGSINLGNKAPTPQITPGGPKAPSLPSGWTMK